MSNAQCPISNVESNRIAIAYLKKFFLEQRL
jgi:hypothetical protein